ncbi:MAG: ABC transporter transmembrane domain-containing protein, partial [Rectinemataceae bacterium]|nr:ABC transporter transmembrane domain-containing protein [Rectinemataceae bacterium]
MIQYIKSILVLFDRRTQWQLGGLSVLMLITAMLEMLGLGLFLPLLQIVADPNVIETNPYIAKAVEILGGGSLSRFTIVFAALLFAFFLVKNVLLLGLTLLQNMFVLKKQAHLQSRILHNYVSRPYVFHLGRNTANLTRNITQSTAMLFTRGLLPLLDIVMELLLVIAVAAILLATEPMATLAVASVFTVSIGGFYMITKGVLADWSHRREDHAENMIRLINEGVGSVKETRILGRENFFVKNFRGEALGQAKCQAFTSTLTQLPRNLTEIVAIGGFGLVILFIYNQGGTIQDAIPVMGLFALATFRLVPSANRILSAVATVRSGIAAVGNITMDFKEFVSA